MRATFRGLVSARAFIIDVGLVGRAEARRRVLDMWRTGLDLRSLAVDQWLAVLPEPVDVRIERAAGTPLVASNGGLAQPGLTGEPGQLVWLDGGSERRVAVDSLDVVPMDGWVDLDDHPVRRLTRLDRPEPAAATLVDPEPPPEPDLRARAGIRAPRRSRRAKGVAPVDRDPASRVRWVVVALALVAVTGLASLAAALAGGGHHPQTSPRSTGVEAPTVASPPPSPTPSQAPSSGSISIGPLPGLPNGTVISLPSTPKSSTGSDFPWGPVVVLLVAGLITGLRRGSRAARAGSAGRAGRASAAPARRRGWLARIVLGSPAQGFVRRRHERYVMSLTRKFDRRDWDAALREAIALGGSGGSWLRLRLPRRRDSVGIRMRQGAGGSVYLGPFAHEHLRTLYQRAAKQLDEGGQIDEAAFVYAELLRDTPAAVTLLERNERLRLAAELAEARKLHPELVVRLWWRAGDRPRAVAIARARGAFGPAVERLAAVDANAARALREQWVRSCQAAGDHLGAVEAAWPEPTLRRLVVPDIEAGVALGGPTSGQLFAHLACEYPSEASAERAVALLEDSSRELRRSRERFIATLAGLEGRDPAHDRRLCTAAVRSALQLEATQANRQQLRALTRRADPLVAADLPSRPAGTRYKNEPIDLTAPTDPGQLPVYDAVTLGGRALLVAHGDLGVRLLTLDGRARARWDVPAHQLVVADNGSSALLVRRAGSTCDIRRLDLVTRRVRPWTLLRLTAVVRSYDGGIVTVVDDRGIALLDVLATQPRVLWRELDPDHRVLRIDRTPTRLTAFLDVPPPLPGGSRSTQLWAWELPSMTLRVRRIIAPERDSRDAAVLADQVVILVADDHGGDPKLVHTREYSKPITTPAPPGATISANGAAFGVTRPVGAERLMTVDVGDRSAAVYATFPVDEDDLGLREHAGIVTVWDRSGRIVAADPGGAGDLVSLRTHF